MTIVYIYDDDGCCLSLKVTGLMTQGRADGQEWVTSYLVSYSLDSINWYYIVDQYDNKLVSTARHSH